MTFHDTYKLSFIKEKKEQKSESSFCSFFFLYFKRLKRDMKLRKKGHIFDVFKNIQSSWI